MVLILSEQNQNFDKVRIRNRKENKEPIYHFSKSGKWNYKSKWHSLNVYGSKFAHNACFFIARLAQSSSAVIWEKYSSIQFDSIQ